MKQQGWPTVTVVPRCVRSLKFSLEFREAASQHLCEPVCASQAVLSSGFYPAGERQTAVENPMPI